MTSPEPTQSGLQSALDLVRTIVQVAIVAVGAIWGYYRFIRSRTFRRRLDVTISGNVRNEGSSAYITISSKVKNVGLSRVKVKQAGTAVEIYSHTAHGAHTTVEVVNWEHLKTLPVFQKHATIEPAETITDEALVALPASAAGQMFKIALRVVSKGFRTFESIEWNALSILERGPTNHQRRSKS